MFLAEIVPTFGFAITSTPDVGKSQICPLNTMVGS
jgi:hypothetical protein